MGIKKIQIKWVPLTLFLLAAAAFLILGIVNFRSSDNLAMVQVFQPDEATQLPFALDMIQDTTTLEQALRQFIFYKHYYYGFPFFAYSAIVLLPLKWLNLLSNMPLTMLVLRQAVSVLPTLVALLLLVYMVDRFRTYRSIVIFLFLFLIPGTFQNSLWWHPDGMVLFLVALVLFLLWKAEGQLNRYFYFAAAVCGILTATKLIGVFFCLAIAIYLLRFFIKTRQAKQTILSGVIFISIMVAAFLISNPFLLSEWARQDYYWMLKGQQQSLSQGFQIVYAKGLTASLPVINQYYGSMILVFAVATAIFGIVSQKTRELSILIIAWVLPLTIYVTKFSHLQYHYLLPVAIPLLLTLSFLFPQRDTWKTSTGFSKGIRLAIATLVLVQLCLFGIQDAKTYANYLVRSQNNPRIEFYDNVQSNFELLKENPLFIYFDSRMYLPREANWQTETTYNLLDYSYISAKNFDVLILDQQRIRDYLNPNAVGIDPAQLALSQEFFRDAKSGNILGFHLIYQDSIGLIFVSETIFQQFFASLK